MAIPIHVVSKLDNAQHAVYRIDEDLPALAASSVRARALLISLTSNNLTYARSGGPLHYPEPYKNRQEWGIVPAWGYGRVVESTVDGIDPGSLLWGMWPTSAHSVDLQLKAAEPAGHWSECSPHQEQLLTIYNHYEQALPLETSDMRTTALCKPLWIAAAAAISLSASSKTGRAFCWELVQNRDLGSHGPLALLQFTSAPTALARYNTSLPIKAASYDDLSEVSWAGQFQPSRIVIVDFSAPDEVLQSLLSTARSIATRVTAIGVGYEAKVYTAEELDVRLSTQLSRVPVNTSGLQDQAIKAAGALEYFSQADTAWKRCLRERAFGGLEVKVFKGVEGRRGIQGAWKDLCDRKVPVNRGMVIELSSN